MLDGGLLVSALSDWFPPPTIASVRARFAGVAQAVNLILTNWGLGGLGQQIVECFCQSEWQEGTQVSALVRGYATLDSSTDPGDDDPYDPTNVALPPAPGYLSAKGSGDFGTIRGGLSPATGPVTLYNNSGSAVSWVGTGLTFSATTNLPGQTFAATYRSATVGPQSVPNGSSLTFDVAAESPGTASNCTASGTAPGSGNTPTPSTTLSLTTVLAATGVSIINGQIIGSDRESAVAYRARCREASALLSPNGPADSYRYLALSANTDGTWGTYSSTPGASTGNALPTSVPIGATRVDIVQASAIGLVQVFIATESGGLDPTDTTTIRNILLTTPGTICAPQAITILVGVGGGAGAQDVSIALTYFCRMKASNVPGGATPGSYTTGGTPPPNVAAVFALIEASVAAELGATDIGGESQNSAGAGVIYTQDLAGAVQATTYTNPTNNSTTLLGIYDVTISVPGTGSTAIGTGGVGVLGAVGGALVLE